MKGGSVEDFGGRINEDVAGGIWSWREDCREKVVTGRKCKGGRKREEMATVRLTSKRVRKHSRSV